MPMQHVEKDEGETVPSIRWNGERSIWERWQKNLKTKVSVAKAKGKGKKKGKGGAAEEEEPAASDAPAPGGRTAANWIKIKIGDGWASAPTRLGADDDDIQDRQVTLFFMLGEHRPIASVATPFPPRSRHHTDRPHHMPPSLF